MLIRLAGDPTSIATKPVFWLAPAASDSAHSTKRNGMCNRRGGGVANATDSELIVEVPIRISARHSSGTRVRAKPLILIERVSSLLLNRFRTLCRFSSEFFL